MYTYNYAVDLGRCSDGDDESCRRLRNLASKVIFSPQTNYSYIRGIPTDSAMDNPVVKEILEKQVLTVAKAMEDKIDEEITALEQLDLDDIEVLRERRLQQMRENGGEKEPNEKEFFSVVKASERVVCHFYHENLPCKVGFDELGGRDDFSTEELEERIAKAQVIHYEGESSGKASISKAPARNVRQGSTSYESDYE